MVVKEIKDSEIQMIHEKTLYILENIGVEFEDQEVIDLFREKGIRTEGTRAYFTEKQVDQALSTVISSFVIKTPYGEVKIGDGGVAVCGAAGARLILKDGKVSTATLEDFINGKKMDASSKVNNILCGPFINCDGIPKEKAALVKTALTLKYSNKPMITFCDTKEHADETIEFVKKFYGAEDGYYTLGVGNVISPLRYAQDDIQAILAYTKRNQPVCITCCSMPGMTSPITIGGTIVQNNAEVLAGVIMTQIVNPGAPIIYGNVTFSSDMRKAVPVSWGPEVAVFMEYAKAMADYYHLPCRVGGAFPASKQIDWQDGAETALSLMSTIDVKSDFIFHSCSELDGLNIFSMEKYVLDEELILARMSVQERDFITEESINIESIEEVGPGGNYLLEDDTLELYRSELYLNELFNTEAYSSWEMNGMPTVLEKAKARVEKRLAEYQPPQYDERQTAMLQEVLAGLDD